MLGEVAHVDEGLVADGALVGSDVVVVADVVSQLARLHEPVGDTEAVERAWGRGPCDSTTPALPWGAALGEVPWHKEGTGRGRSPLAAALADVGLLPRVLAHVGNEGAGLGESLPADQALARLLSWGGSRRAQPRGDRNSTPISPRKPRAPGEAPQVGRAVFLPVWMRTCRCSAPGSANCRWQ